MTTDQTYLNGDAHWHKGDPDRVEACCVKPVTHKLSWQEAVLRVSEAGQSLANARVAEAEEFITRRASGIAGTDGMAKAMAVIATKSAVDTAEAEMRAAEAYLQVAVAEIAREKV